MSDMVNTTDWDKRLALTLRRARELSLFGYLNTPNQGILFNDTTPIDEWKYPSDGIRVRGKNAARISGTQPCSGGSTPPLVLSKDTATSSHPHVHVASRSTFQPPVNTQFVTGQRGMQYGNNMTMLSPIYHNQVGAQNRTTDRTYDRGMSPLDLAPGIRGFCGYDMPSMSAPPDNLIGLQVVLPKFGSVRFSHLFWRTENRTGRPGLEPNQNWNRTG
jgi:hypothetical protein